MSDNVIGLMDTGDLKVGIFPYYVIRHGVAILLFGSLIRYLFRLWRKFSSDDVLYSSPLTVRASK